jgi:hypothetical protein
MGYNTDFEGRLDFTCHITSDMLKYLKEMLDIDLRSNPLFLDDKYKVEEKHLGLTWVDLSVTEDEKGIEWNESEKTYDLDKKIDNLILCMKKIYPSFGLTGILRAQGEKSDDMWSIIVNEDKVEVISADDPYVSAEKRYNELISGNTEINTVYALIENKELISSIESGTNHLYIVFADRVCNSLSSVSYIDIESEFQKQIINYEASGGNPDLSVVISYHAEKANSLKEFFNELKKDRVYEQYGIYLIKTLNQLFDETIRELNKKDKQF